jgi:hypothetical protein
VKPQFALELEQHLNILLTKKYVDVKVNVFQIYGPHNMEEMDGFSADIISDTFLDGWITHLPDLTKFLWDHGFQNVQMTLLPVSHEAFFSERVGPEWDGN